MIFNRSPSYLSSMFHIPFGSGAVANWPPRWAHHFRYFREGRWDGQLPSERFAGDLAMTWELGAVRMYRSALYRYCIVNIISCLHTYIVFIYVIWCTPCRHTVVFMNTDCLNTSKISISPNKCSIVWYFGLGGSKFIPWAFNRGHHWRPTLGSGTGKCCAILGTGELPHCHTDWKEFCWQCSRRLLGDRYLGLKLPNISYVYIYIHM